MNSISEWSKRIAFYLLCLLIGYGIDHYARYFGVSGSFEKSLFSNIAISLGVLHAACFAAMKTVADIKFDEGLRSYVRERLYREATERKATTNFRLISGIVFAVVLQLCSSLLLDDSKIAQQPWSSVGFGCIPIVIGCLIFSIVDYCRFSDLAMQINKIGTDERSRKRELESLNQ